MDSLKEYLNKEQECLRKVYGTGNPASSPAAAIAILARRLQKENTAPTVPIDDLEDVLRKAESKL